VFFYFVRIGTIGFEYCSMVWWWELNGKMVGRDLVVVVLRVYIHFWTGSFSVTCGVDYTRVKSSIWYHREYSLSNTPPARVF